MYIKINENIYSVWVYKYFNMFKYIYTYTYGLCLYIYGIYTYIYIHRRCSTAKQKIAPFLAPKTAGHTAVVLHHECRRRGPTPPENAQSRTCKRLRQLSGNRAKHSSTRSTRTRRDRSRLEVILQHLFPL